MDQGLGARPGLISFRARKVQKLDGGVKGRPTTKPPMRQSPWQRGLGRARARAFQVAAIARDGYRELGAGKAREFAEVTAWLDRCR